MSLFRNDAGVGFEKRWCWRCWESGGMRFNTGLESELIERAMPEADEGKFLPEAEDMESSED